MTLVGWMAALPAFAGTEWTYEDIALVDEGILAFEDLSFERAGRADDRLAPWVAAKDKTAPILELRIVWADDAGLVHDEGVLTAPRTLRLPETAFVTITATATETDGGAIDDVWLSGETSSSCEGGGFGRTVHNPWYAGSPDPDPRDGVNFDWRLASIGFPVPPLACDPGTSFVGGSGYLQASAVNRAGLVTRSVVVFLDLVP